MCHLAFRICVVVLAAVGLSSAEGQPIPVEGTEMVPNEYGGSFPREITWEKDGAVMVLVPFGSFTRGLGAEGGGAANEGPETQVQLSSFYIDKFEVSNEQYSKFLKDNSFAVRPRPTGNEELRQLDHPVSAVPWLAAENYAKWAGKELPTEAMWEKAARGPDNSVYTSGSEPPSDQTAIYNRGSQGSTSAVDKDSGDVSGYGVLHMSGNVSEWTRDWYAREAYQGSPTENPTGPAAGESKVYRGGNFLTTQSQDLRTTRRSGYPPTQILDELGFRTVWVPTPKPVEEVRVEPTPTLPPLPTTDEILQQMAAKIKGYLDDRVEKLPREFMAGKAYLGRGEGETQFINFTPFDLSLSFVGPDEYLVFKYNEPLPAMSYRNVMLAKERNLSILAYAPGAPRPGPVNLGTIRAESQAIVLVRTELFSPLTNEKGEAVPMADRTMADQYYSDFQPMWNELEILNTLDLPLVVKGEDITRGEKDIIPAGEYLVAPGAIQRLKLEPGSYRFRADYIGAVEDSSTPVSVRIDDKAARRLIRLSQDKDREERVTVITEKRPYVTLSLLEARKISFSKVDATKKK